MRIILPIVLLTCLSFLNHAHSQDGDWAKQQIDLINIDCLHEKGFTGKGITIAHFDDGCDGCDEIDVFKYSIKNGYWKGLHDFVDDDEIDYKNEGSHGTATVSIFHGKLDGKYTGIAYDANILMARTENINSETHQEERDWRDAVDWAIENGADIITSSLQYNNFDKGEGDFTYEDMDGGTTIITNAADYAASKGLIVVTLQGNFGSSKWYYVSAPGDADSVITVGAATAKGIKANFSGFGPSSDGRMKPDIMAMGQSTAVANPDGSISRGNGTSYAAPAIAGLMACLKQAHPDRTNMQFISAVRQSGDRYRNPTAKEGYGYGTADACAAHEILNDIDKSLRQKGKWIVKPDFRFKERKNKIIVKPISKNNKVVKIILKDIFEKVIRTNPSIRIVDTEKLENGDYLLDIYLENNEVKTVYFSK